MVKLSIDLPSGFLDYEAKTLVVSPKRKQVWAVALDLLAQLDRVCKKYGIRYFCDGGTSLGAARHKGFVPWDDDLDVIMSRPEYNRLNAIAPQEFKHPYFWQTNETDPGSVRGHAQLRNSETTGILKCEMINGKPIYSFNQGLFIDIFPFDNVPDDLLEREVFIRDVEAEKRRVWLVRGELQKVKKLKNHPSIRSAIRGFGPVVKEGVAKLLKYNRLAKECDRFERLVQKYNTLKTREMAPISFKARHREVLPSYFFDEAVELDFEFMKIPVMKHYQEALAVNYGDWHEHVVGGASHGGMLVDVNRSYREYL